MLQVKRKWEALRQEQEVLRGEEARYMEQVCVGVWRARARLCACVVGESGEGGLAARIWPPASCSHICAVACKLHMLPNTLLQEAARRSAVAATLALADSEMQTRQGRVQAK